MLDHDKFKRAKVTFAAAFPKALSATINGEPVRLTHIGDVEGMSPAYNVVDSEGRSSWQPQADVKIVDTDYLPLSAEALTGLGSSSASGSSSPRTSRESYPSAQRS